MSDSTIKKRLAKLNSDLAKERTEFLIPFEFDDLTYIFVKYEKDLDKVIKAIRNVETTAHQQDRLISKIITSRQIEMDF